MININNLGKKLSKEYIITINYSLPYISLTNNPSKEELLKPTIYKGKKEYYTKAEHILNHSIWFAQGEDAQNLIDSIPKNINHEYFLLWYLKSSGVF